MDPMADEQLDFGDEECGGAQKMQYHGGGAIHALAEDEMTGVEDEYDDLYNDVNVGEGLLQMQHSEASAPLTSTAAGNGGYQAQKPIIPEARAQVVSQEQSLHGIAPEGKYDTTEVQFSGKKEGMVLDRGPGLGVFDVSQKGKVQETAHGARAGVSGFRGMNSVPPKTAVDLLDISEKMANDSAPLLNSGTGGPRSLPQIPANQMSTNVNINIDCSVVSENLVRPAVENGNNMLFVGELHWWTTDAELEGVLSQYGRVKEIKFFDERASGKSKGYCQVEFYEPAAAAACKEGMNGCVFNGRACVVAFASPQTIKQMAASYTNKTQAPPQPHSQGRRPMNDGAGRVGGTNYPSGDAGRNYGRGGGRGGQGMIGRGMGGGHMRGRGGSMGAKNMLGNALGMGSGPSGGAFGQALACSPFGGPPGGLMHPQGVMGTGFDPTYMGRGAGYGGFPGPAFPGMLPPYPGVNAMGLTGVAPHVNPAFFGRGMALNGMGMMGTSGMDGHHAGMWGDASVGGWGGVEQGQKTRESSYVGEDGASEYGEATHDKGARSSVSSREKERDSERRDSERNWSGSYEKRYRDETEQGRDKYDRDYRHREDKDNYRDHWQKERELGYEDDWDRGHSSSRSRSRSRAMPEEDHRPRSRDAEYVKRRRAPSE